MALKSSIYHRREQWHWSHPFTTAESNGIEVIHLPPQRAMAESNGIEVIHLPPQRAMALKSSIYHRREQWHWSHPFTTAESQWHWSHPFTTVESNGIEVIHLPPQRAMALKSSIYHRREQWHWSHPFTTTESNGIEVIHLPLQRAMALKSSIYHRREQWHWSHPGDVFKPFRYLASPAKKETWEDSTRER